MANIEATLKTLLGNLVSGRCYPLVNDSASIVLPYITFQKITGFELVVVQDNLNREEMRFQIDAFDRTYDGVKALAASIKSSMNSASFANYKITDFDGYEDESKEAHVTLEYYIWA